MRAVVEFITLAMTDWLEFLLDQPKSPLFEQNRLFEDESSRVARLLVAVVMLSGVVLGTSQLVLDKEATVSLARTALGILCAAILIALFYKPIANAVGVRISLRQAVFSVLYIGLPWLPVLCFIWGAVLATHGFLRICLLVSYYVCFAYVATNFIKAVKTITTKSTYRVAMSVYGPLVLALAFVLFRC